MSDPKRYIIVGVGGVGIPLAKMVVRQLTFEAPGSGLILVDGDSYEEKNKTRQEFQILGNKAQVLAEELAPQFIETTVIGLPKWIIESSEEANSYDPGSEESVDGSAVAGKIAAIDLLDENDIVFAVVDNFAARKIIFDAAAKKDNIDVFTGGNDEGYFGSYIHYQRRNGVDITPNPASHERFEEFSNPADRNPGEMSCQERAEVEGGTQIMSTNNLVASVLAMRSHAVVFGGDEPNPSLIYLQLDKGMAAGEDLRCNKETIKETTGV